MLELRPGLEQVGRQLVEALVRLARGRPGHGIAPKKLLDNPYWPLRLAEKAGQLPHERFVVLAPLALSRTQDDKGRVRWTLFGGSEQGPERAFWKSFSQRSGPGSAGGGGRRFHPPPAGRRLRRRRSATPTTSTSSASASCPPTSATPCTGRPTRRCRPGPPATCYRPRQSVERREVPAHLPPVRPTAGGDPDRLSRRPAAPAALPRQPDLLGCARRREAARRICRWPCRRRCSTSSSATRRRTACACRRPAGCTSRSRASAEPNHEYGPVRNTFRRTHRWAKVLRDQDELALMGREDKLLHVLFSTIPDDLGLYDKPMARNVQLWTHDYRLLLDGPRASGADMKATLHTVEEGGMFGYRFVYPAMRVGRHEVYWHRPLVAWLSESGGPGHAARRPARLSHGLRGRPRPNPAPTRGGREGRGRVIELWPRLLGATCLPSRRSFSRIQATHVRHAPAASASCSTPGNCPAKTRCRARFARSLLAAPEAPDARRLAGRAARGGRRRRGRRTHRRRA